MPLQSTALADAPVDKILSHEAAAHEKRNWVRLTFDCNDRCIFCLDSNTHTGEMRSVSQVRDQILEGRRKGAERLILSGGEPTIHPNYVDFIRFGRATGYPWIQTVTNGRMFSYANFLTRCADEGLSEITFSIHGPNARIHDALVGTKGAFEQEMRGLENALADGRLVVNIDVVVNRANVKHLPEMLHKYYAMGVREFDLLQVVPFGRAFTEGRDTLFYDLREARPYLLEALEFSKRPDVHVWMNRFPPPHLEGFEHLIQDPYKLTDEVRGRKEEFGLLLDWGTELDCRDPKRCRYCYLENLCDELRSVQTVYDHRTFDVVRIDTESETHVAPIYGGDPASARRAEQDGKRRLPMAAGTAPTVPRLAEVIANATPSTLWIAAPTLEAALREAERYPQVPGIALELEDYAGLELALLNGEGRLSGRLLQRVLTRSAKAAATLLELPGSFEVVVVLSQETAPWLLALEVCSPQLVLRMPTWERRSDSASNDVSLRDFFGTFAGQAPVEGVPACILGRPPRAEPATLDTSMMTQEGRFEIFRYVKRYIASHYFTKPLRCGGCVYDSTCRGLHVNYVRAHGYSELQPIEVTSSS